VIKINSYTQKVYVFFEDPLYIYVTPIMKLVITANTISKQLRWHR